MFTLLPTVQKERLSKEYKLRIAVLLVSSVGVSVFVSCVLLFPAYLASNIKIKDALIKKQSLETSSLYKEKAELRETVTKVQDELALVGVDGASPITIIDELQQETKSPAIKLFHIEYQHSARVGILILNGKAATRQILLDYKKQLEANPKFSEVKFPISDLSKSVDIEFTFTISGTF